MSEPRESTLEVAQDLRVHLVEWGPEDGWPVAILHGGAHNSGCWEAVSRLLSEHFRVLVPDQRGHGRSDWAPDGDYSCQAQADDFVRILDTLEIERVALVGHSMGGLNALLVAGTHPDRVSALVLVDVGTDTRETGLKAVQSSPKRAPRPMDRDAALAWLSRTYPDREASWIEERLDTDLLRLDSGHWRPRFDMRLLDFVPTYCGDREERRRLLVAAAAPLLVMRGARSRLMPLESARNTASLVNGSMVEIPDAGHNVSLDNPEAVGARLCEFLLPLAEPQVAVQPPSTSTT